MPSRFFRPTILAVGLLFMSAPAIAAVPGPSPGILLKQTNGWQMPYNPIDIAQSADGTAIYILTENNQVLVYEPNGNLKGSFPVDPGVVAIDTDVRGEFVFLIDQQQKTLRKIAVDFHTDIDISGSPFKGKPDAPVTIAVFSDFEWPYCGKVVPLLEQVFENNKDTVKMVFKNMPLSFHKYAMPSAQAGLAAFRQGKFWEFHDAIFSSGKLNDQSINEVAAKIGLDMSQFNSDMNSAAVREQIEKDMADAQQAGVRGTPTIFINGRKLKERSLQGLQTAINEELQAAGRKQ